MDVLAMSVRGSGHRADRADSRSEWVGVVVDSGRRAWLLVAAKAATMWLRRGGVLVRKDASAKAVLALARVAEDKVSVRRG